MNESLMPIIMTVLRYGGTALGGVLVSRGGLDPSQAETIVGGLLAIVSTVIGAYLTRRNENEKARLRGY